MFLNAIAQRYMTEKFDGYDQPSNSFLPNTFQGRIDLTDRFLSIYNRPTRKRQLFVKPEENLPESMVFRHPKTGDVYIIGQGRKDARGDIDDGNPYVMLCMLHLVNENSMGSSGVCTQTRRIVEGPADDPGWLVDVVISRPYLDMEFRTNTSEAGMYESKVANYYAWMPLITEVKQWDVLTLHGEKYRVVDSFTDMGMRGLRLDKEADPRVDLVIHTSKRTYNKVTHEYEEVKRDYNVTGIVPDNTEMATWAGDRESSQISVIFEFDHIGFKPEPNTKISFQGRVRTIKSVITQAGEKQYKVICE